MSLVEHLARPEILALEPYSHAAWDPTLERLHANENPWRSPVDGSGAGLNRYPEPHPLALEARLAALYGVEASSLIAGRGSDEGIDLLCRAFLAAGRDAALICPPTFGMYAVAARIQGARVVEVPLRSRDWSLDPGAVLAAVTPEVKLVFLCSPGNPTGRALDTGAIEAVLRGLATRALVVVDEAYAEFSAALSFASRLGEFPNLVVLRTLSKAYALAGARCGALIAAEPIVSLLRRIIPPYSMPTPSIEAVLAALGETPLAEARARIARLLLERTRLATGLASSPWVRRVCPSDANFLYVECTEAATVLQRATGAGLLIRDFSRGTRTSGGVRVTVGSPTQNDRLIEALGRP
jgi:histidinol-phosphate aminotransferase